MTFWKKLQLLGSILTLCVGALTVGAAFVLSPDTARPAPTPVTPKPHPGLEGLRGTTGL